MSPVALLRVFTNIQPESDLVNSAHSNSDDNMLKNIELFDKLSLRFNGRVLFIKDVIGDEICCWSFYGQGRKIAEVCCTSIVYATEKKQTKVYISGAVMIHPVCFGLSVKPWVCLW